METDEKPRGEDATALSGGHLCHVCGFQYPNPHPSAKLRRSHRKHCGKAVPAPAAVEEEEEVPVGQPVSDRAEGNAGERTLREPVGGKGGEEDGESEENGGAVLLGSAREVGESFEDKAIAGHASSNGTGVHHTTRENGQINCMNTEYASPDDNNVNSEFSKNGIVDGSSNFELVTEGNGAHLPIACNNGSQNVAAKHCSELASAVVTNPAEREDSIDEFQDASPFLHQSDSDDCALPSPEFPVEISSLSNAFSVSSAAANEISLGTDGLCNAEVSGELNLNDLSPGSKVGNDSENGPLSLVGPGARLKVEVPYESYNNVGSNQADMVDHEPDKRFYHESIGTDASSVQEAHSVVLEASPKPEAAETSNGQLETLTRSSSNSMPTSNELMVVHFENNSTDSSTELSTHPVKDTSDVPLPGETNLPPTRNVDDTLNFKDSYSDMDFSFEAMTQQDVEQVNVTEEKRSVQKTSGFTEDEGFSKQIDSEVPTEHQFAKSQKCDVLPTGQTSCAKNPFDLDDDRNDDLFELPTDSCYLEVPSPSRPGSASLILNQPTVSNSNQTRMTGAHHSCKNAASSSSENGHPTGPKDKPDSSGAELVMTTCLADVSLDQHLQEDEAHANGISDRHLQEDEAHTDGISLASYQVAPMEYHTVDTQGTSPLGTGTEENTETKDGATKEVTVVHITDDEMKQAGDTTAPDTYTTNVEAKKVTDNSAAKMIEVQHCSAEEKHTDNTKDVSLMQSMSYLGENKLTEDPSTKDMNPLEQAVDRFEEMCAQATREKEVVALQCTAKVDKNKQTNAIVGQEGDNKKEEIAVTGGRLNSGRVRVPLKVLLAEASAENKVNKPSAKERVLSFGRRASRNDNASAKSGSDDRRWDSPAKLPHKDTDKSSRGKKQPWMPFICCHSVR